ncbi:MAG: hypothetical protein IJ009_05220 [Clostridia bacterium]|nr:hypothetical protein [Clostridia bacterium]MBQ8859639.1 hypothetical protein [Clostridia bacterium]
MKNKEFSAHRPQHIVAKIVCLLLAVIIWLYVMYVEAPLYEQVFEDVVVTVKASEGTPWQIDDPTISVRVRGTKMELATYNAENVVAYILPSDYPDAQPLDSTGFYAFPVRFQLPGALSVKGDYTITVRNLKEAPLS